MQIIWIAVFVAIGAPAESQPVTGAKGAAAAAGPIWLRRPHSGEISRYFPPKASHQGVSGFALVQCAVDPNGRLADCEVAQESPPGMGFGAATLKLMRSFALDMSAPGSKALVGHRIQQPMTWWADADAEASECYAAHVTDLDRRAELSDGEGPRWAQRLIKHHFGGFDVNGSAYGQFRADFERRMARQDQLAIEGSPPQLELRTCRRSYPELRRNDPPG